MSKTTSSSKYDVSIGNNIPVWHPLSGNVLEANGWKRIGTEYRKDGTTIKYNGYQWKIGELKFQWIEDLNDYLSTGKLPEE